MEKEFQVHRLNDEGMQKAIDIATQFSDLLRFCKSVAEPGRELSIVATKLEEAAFFAKKALAINKKYQI